jgi:signal peptidase
MRPTFALGDVVVVTPKPARDVRAGDVITYAIPIGDRHVETHRVVEVLRGGEAPIVRTKGDANAAADPWTAQLEGGLVWQQRFTVPGLGWPIVFARKPLVHVFSLFLLPALLVAAGLVRIWCRPRAGHAATSTHAAAA